jgi:hypothetical protein
MAKEVRIHLTPSQKAKIKSATGKSLGEIRVSPVGKNLSAKFTAKPAMLQARKATKPMVQARATRASIIHSRKATKPVLQARRATKPMLQARKATKASIIHARRATRFTARKATRR